MRLNPQNTPPAGTNSVSADGGPPYEIQSSGLCHFSLPITELKMFTECRA
jgi:hypothetical protein